MNLLNPLLQPTLQSAGERVRDAVVAGIASATNEKVQSTSSIDLSATATAQQRENAIAEHAHRLRLAGIDIEHANAVLLAAQGEMRLSRGKDILIGAAIGFAAGWIAGSLVERRR